MDFPDYFLGYEGHFRNIFTIVIASLLGATAYENVPCMGYEYTGIIEQAIITNYLGAKLNICSNLNLRKINISGVMNIPNQFIRDIRVSPIIDQDNFIRLNVTLQSFKEFENLTGSIRVFSKDIGASCHRYREHYFQLEEKQFLVPRYDFPEEEEEIRKLCEYIIDLDVKGNCILFSDSFIVPSFLGKHEKDSEKLTQCTPLVRITGVGLQENGILRVNWNSESTINFTDIIYFIRVVNLNSTIQELKNVTNYNNYSIIFFNDLQNNTDYELMGKFIAGRDCYNISSFPFAFADDEDRTSSSEVLYETSNYTIHIIYFLLFIITFSIIVALIITKNKSATPTRSTSNYLSYPNHSTNIIQSNKENPPYIIVSNTDSEDFIELEVNPRNVTIGDRLGGGAFGEVYYADVLDIKMIENSPKQVAVKIPKDSSPYKSESILEEIRTMQKIGFHPNIVKLLGCCTREKPYMIIMELVEEGKSLKEYLKELRRRWEITKVSTYPKYKKMTSGLSGGTVWQVQKQQARASPKEEIYCEMKNILDSKELQNFAIQIARGMQHLEVLKIVHRDLAARNILMTKNKTLKISDFGMSKTEAYFSFNPYKQPARWMAIESLKFKFFNTKTDVWSFGVVLWELGTLGALPYKEVEDNLLIFHLSQGARLGKPQICTNEMYSVMQKCWLENPDLRPTFKELVRVLDVEDTKIYVITNVQEITPPSMLFRGEGS